MVIRPWTILSSLLLLLLLGSASLLSSTTPISHAGGAPTPDEASAVTASASGPMIDTVREDGFPLIRLPIVPGWNLVGWLGSDSESGPLTSIEADVQSVFAFDPRTSSFERFRPAGPTALNSLGVMQDGAGLWIFSETPGTWLQEAPWWGRTIPLQVGFNLVTWTGANATPIEEAIASLGDAFSAAFTWDPLAQQFRSYAPDRPDILNTVVTLDYGEGVWISVTSRSEWTQPAPQRIGTQDFWILHRVATVVDDIWTDVTDTVLNAAKADAGPPQALGSGLLLRMDEEPDGRAFADNGVDLPNVRIFTGVASIDPAASLSDWIAGQHLLRGATEALIVVSSAHLDEALYNIDGDDQIWFDLPGITTLDAVELSLDFLFGQTLERVHP
ncbi:MAG TPA: hypothetical protein QGF05_06215 [Dehalococcoidia bacterium]|nr:hypothetical protein [Dehalococcoidia bacterium]